jgi:peroxiredoxin
MNNRLPGIILFLTAALLLLGSCSEQGAKTIRTGDTIAPFTGTDLHGNSFALADHRGKPVIVRFFLVNCPYCKADTPIFNKFYRQYGGNDLAMVYINTNGTDIKEVETFVQELNVEFPVIYDPKGTIARKYHVKAQPLTLVLSPEHKLLAALLGGVSEEELDELLNGYL